MTPKDKAKELVSRYVHYSKSWKLDKQDAKQCALIAVELRLDADFQFSDIEFGEQSIEYWEQVKNEIELL